MKTRLLIFIEQVTVMEMKHRSGHEKSSKYCW